MMVLPEFSGQAERCENFGGADRAILL